MAHYQPRWAEWLRQTGGGKTWEFMAWIRERWAEFLKESPSPEYWASRHDEFDTWLAKGEDLGGKGEEFAPKGEDLSSAPLRKEAA